MTHLITAAAIAALLAAGPALANPKAKKAAAPEPEPAAVALSDGQMEAAGRVYTGEAQCEFGEKIRLTPVDGRPGHFHLHHKKARYTVVPEETTTGAVRLEDRRQGIVWLQIPAKSMLMNARIGQRVADNCLHAEQRVESAAAPAADGAIGIAAARP